MSPAVEKLAFRAVINYMAGNMEDFRKLLKMAMDIREKSLCNECGELLISCKFGHKGHMQEAILCTKCGKIHIGNNQVRKVHGIC